MMVAPRMIAFPLLLITKLVIGGPLTQDEGWLINNFYQVKSSLSVGSNLHISKEPFPGNDEDKRETNSNLEAVALKQFSDNGTICTHLGIFPKTGSCEDYYQCTKTSRYAKSFSVQMFSCPEGKVFDEISKSCEYSHRAATRPECKGVEEFKVPRSERDEVLNTIELLQQDTPNINTNHTRQKRFAFLSAITGILQHPLAQAAIGILGGNSEEQSSDNYGETLENLEYQLEGINGNIHNVQLSILESQTESRLQATILKNLIRKSNKDNEVSFAVTQNLIKSGILENHIRTAEIKGLISKQRIENENNFAKVQVSLGELENFIRRETADMKNDIKRGFESVSQIIDQSRVEPLVSRLLTTIKTFNQRANHIKSLSEESKIEAIKRHGGYLDYLESSVITYTLQDIIQQNMAIPNDVVDMTAVFTLDMLVQGLQVHANMLSSVVLSHSFLAAKALEKNNLEDFNTYMLRLSASVSRVQLELGNRDGHGIIGEVIGVFDKVQKLPYSANMFGLTELIAEKRSVIGKLEADIESLIKINTELNQPGTIIRKPYFGTPSVATPIGSWKIGKGVSYAIQYISETGISRLGAWSPTYNIIDKANPIIYLQAVPEGIVRVIYRKFDLENPERVAVIEDHTRVIFRDINYDLLKAAAQPNEEQAIKEVTTLVEGGSDINTFLGNKMTPLHYAAKHGNVAVMDFLLVNGADIHAKTADNEEPLHFAVLFGATAGVEYLLGKGARINSQTKSLGLAPLHIAVANNHIGVTRALIQNGVFVNIKDNNGFTPLHMSIVGNGDTTDVLLESNTVNVNAMDNSGLTPLHYAARSSNAAFVMKLLRHRDINQNPLTESLLSPMHFAAMTDNVAAISELYRHGVPVTVKDRLGSTPLHYAAFYGSENVALALTEIDESLKENKNNEDKLPLDLANENKRTKVAEIVQINHIEILDKTVKEPKYVETTTEKAPEPNPVRECVSSTADAMARSSEETCAHIGNVEDYVSLVMSMVPLELYYANQAEFTEIFGNYDRDLLIAKNHAKVWRNGDSIVGGIRETFELAKVFEPEFTRKYKVNQQRVEVIKQNANQVKMINATKGDINELEDQLTSAIEAMNQVSLPTVRAYFQVTIAKINKKIDEKKRQLSEDFILTQELEELVDFLEFVRRDSDKIRAVALKTREKIEIFKNNLEHDKGAFEIHRRVAGETFERLQIETIKNNQALEENKRRQEQIEQNMVEERKQIKDLYAQIHESHRQLREMRRKIIKKISKTKTLKIIGAVLTPVVVGAFLYNHAKKEEKKLAGLLQSTLTEGRISIDALHLQISNNQNELKFLQGQMANSTSNSEELRDELNDFITLDGDLKVMADKVETLLEAINNALVGVKVIKSVFDDVTKKLTEMIDVARSAKTEAEKLNVKLLIENELSLLECNWKDVYFNVMSLDECTKMFDILY